MITLEMLERFLGSARGQALREGTRYAREARVQGFTGTAESVTTVVGGATKDWNVALWSEGEALAHRCECPSWRDPCKHEVAAAMVLRQCLSKPKEGNGKGAAGEDEEDAQGDRDGATVTPDRKIEDPEAARKRALDERRTAARREGLRVAPGAPPVLEVSSPSGFTYRVQVRGGPGGPHGCDCPDFEANRLHACKHVERVRRFLAGSGGRLAPAFHRAARRPRVYLHFGEVVEPRLLGWPEGGGAGRVRKAFGADGPPAESVPRDERPLGDWLAGLGNWVEPEAIEWLRGRAARRPALPEEPFQALLPPLSLKPYPYQWEGAEFLARAGRALLADEMGLGKTVQAILAAAALRKADAPVEHVTIVCPASLRGGWQEEIRRWIGEEATLLAGPALERARVIASRPRWLVTHYEQVVRDYRVHGAHPPDLLIVDEAQRAKGLKTRTARVLKAIGARHVFALTGTPLENRLEEAYAISQLVDQRLLPPLWQVDRDHFLRDPDGRRVVMYRNLDALRSRLAPAFLRRRKEDVSLQLPNRVRSLENVPMHPKVVATYDDVMGQVAMIAGKKVILPADLDRMQKLLVIARRCCNGPHMLGIDVDDRKVPKLAVLEDALRELCLGEGRKAILFSEWTDMTDRVEALCDRLGLPSFHLHGGVPVGKRPSLVRGFAETRGPAAFISTDAGGVGLNLQAADVVVNLDLPWNPAKLEQRIARAHRIGSKRTVQILLVVTKESVEERILALHDTKRNVLDNIWAKKGEDQIAAPGGSGLFREMVKALLATRPPMEPAGTEPPKTPSIAAAARNGNGDGKAAGREGSGAARRGGPIPSGERIRPPLEAPAAVPPPAPAVDPGALAAAVAAVAPALPAEHRRSLSLVFRALADALGP